MTLIGVSAFFSWKKTPAARPEASRPEALVTRPMRLPASDCSRGISGDEVRAYRIADNKLALDAGWDEELLAAEFHELNGTGYDLGLTGFSQDELDELIWRGHRAGWQVAIHAIGDRGGKVGPDLTRNSIHKDAAWMIQHFKRPSAMRPR